MANIHSNISFALVNIPVVMNPVIKNNDTSFNQLHTKCMHRISYVKYCPHCKSNIKEKDIILIKKQVLHMLASRQLKRINIFSEKMVVL